jgi:uncharacterized protein YjeT (DUF2065 family)
MFIWNGLALSLFLKGTRRSWAILEQSSDAKLWRVGIALMLAGGLFFL